MLSRTSAAYQQVQDSRHALLHGVVVSIDPSVGSQSSMPGYAVYHCTELVESGILELPVGTPIWQRLRQLVHQVRQLYKKYDPDVLVYEEIPPQRYGGGGNAGAHASLLKSVGAILSVSGPQQYVGLMPVSWKKMVRDTYVKGDENDAKEMGWIAIEEARRIPEKTTRQPRRKST